MIELRSIPVAGKEPHPSQNLNFAIPADAIEVLELRSKDAPTLGNDYVSVPPIAAEASAMNGLPAGAPPPRQVVVPTALGSIRAVVLSVSSKGPIAFGGGVSEYWMVRSISSRLRASGIAVYGSQDDARKDSVYALPLYVSVGSMKIEDSVLYPWQIQIELMDNSDMSDGTNAMITIWSNGSYGFGGSGVVVDQVSTTLTKLVGTLADEMSTSRNAEIRPRSDIIR